MYYIRKGSIKYNNGEPYEAHLLTIDGDVHVGQLWNLSKDKFTYIHTMPHHNLELARIAKLNMTNVYTLLDMYMKAAEGKPVIIKTFQIDQQ